MLRVPKGEAPRELVAHRAARGTYDNITLSDKASLRERLCKDQGNLCVYCMRRLKIEDVKIEHFVAQSTDDSLALDWQNMFAACEGRPSPKRYRTTSEEAVETEFFPSHRQTCDTRKGSSPLDPRLHPTHPAIEERFTYRHDGTVLVIDPSTGAKDQELFEQLGRIAEDQTSKNRGVLNLNDSNLRRARELALQSFQAELSKKHRGAWSKQVLEREAKRLETSPASSLPDYTGCLRYFLERKLGKRHQPPPPSDDDWAEALATPRRA